MSVRKDRNEQNETEIDQVDTENSQDIKFDT